MGIISPHVQAYKGEDRRGNVTHNVKSHFYTAQSFECVGVLAVSSHVTTPMSANKAGEQKKAA